MSINEVLEREQRVRLLSGEKGITIGKNENFEFPLWEISSSGTVGGESEFPGSFNTSGSVKTSNLDIASVRNFSILQLDLP
jgi:hypothetical protein